MTEKFKRYIEDEVYKRINLGFLLPNAIKGSCKIFEVCEVLFEKDDEFNPDEQFYVSMTLRCHDGLSYSHSHYINRCIIRNYKLKKINDRR